MQGDATVIQHLNAVLRNEMTAVNQYFLHARMLEHWGAVRLGAHEYDESIDEMKHADLLIKRLLFLGGEPRLEFDRLLIGKSVPHTVDGDIQVGVTLLKHLLTAFDGNERLALAAWYQGERAVRSYGVYDVTKPFVDDVLALSQRM